MNASSACSRDDCADWHVQAQRRGPEVAVRPEGANHLWRKKPPRELSIDLVADERLGRVTGRPEPGLNRIDFGHYGPDRWLTGFLAGQRGTLPMPWKETCVMDEKLAFIAEYLRGELPMTVLCERYGISRELAT